MTHIYVGGLLVMLLIAIRAHTVRIVPTVDANSSEYAFRNWKGKRSLLIVSANVIVVTLLVAAAGLHYVSEYKYASIAWGIAFGVFLLIHAYIVVTKPD